MAVIPNGQVGMMRVDVEPMENTVSVLYGFKDGQRTDDAATAILITGFEKPPRVIINDVVHEADLATTEFEGASAYVIPLE